jgi:hypothetical protein
VASDNLRSCVGNNNKMSVYYEASYYTQAISSVVTRSVSNSENNSVTRRLVADQRYGVLAEN